MLQNTQLDNRAVIRYSNAYYGITVKNKTHMSEEIKKLLQYFESNKDFHILFKSPLLNKKQQILLALRMFGVNEKKKISVSKHLQGLIMLLAKNSKLHLLEDVLKRCYELQISDNKEIKVIVTSVSKIRESLVDKIKKVFSKKGKVTVKIINVINEELLGGLIIQVGSNLIDTSVRTKLNKIKNAMKGAN